MCAGLSVQKLFQVDSTNADTVADSDMRQRPVFDQAAHCIATHTEKSCGVSNTQRCGQAFIVGGCKSITHHSPPCFSSPSFINCRIFSLSKSSATVARV